MSGVEMTSEGATEMPTEVVDLKLELVVVPVSDVDRAKRFYQTLGFREASRDAAAYMEGQRARQGLSS
jgi:Bleomycin resistance protein-like N-terminal